MTIVLIVLLGIAAALILWAIWTYNRLVRQRAMKDEAWSGVSVQLKRRHDLIPNLVASVRGVTGHEKNVLESVTSARAVRNVGDAVQAEQKLSRELHGFLAVAEAYPEVKGSAAFQQLMTELSGTEEEIQMARRYYNGCVRELNTTVEIFPSCLIAGLAGFDKAEFFDLDDASEAEVPKVLF